MNTALWIVTGLLAALFLAAGLMKATRTKAQLAQNPRMSWVEDVDGRLIRTVGILEVLGALGLVLPALTGITPVLVPLAAVGLAITMAGAIVVHARRHETAGVVQGVVIFALLAFVAWGRFGPYAFSS